MRNKTRYLSGALFAAVLALTAAVTLADQPQDAPDGPPPPQRPNPILALFDTDKDGALSAEEIANASAILKTLDANGDGQITTDELPPPPPSCHKPGHGPNGPPSPEDL